MGIGGIAAIMAITHLPDPRAPCRGQIGVLEFCIVICSETFLGIAGTVLDNLLLNQAR
jgi:hypothetical protein